MYADDTHLTFAAKTVSNIDSNLNEDLSRVNNWLTANKLTLNTSKTEFMMIGSRQRLNTFDTPPSLEIDGAPVSQVTFTKSLGVYIDQNLSWNVHVNNLCKTIAAGIGVIKRSRAFVPFDTLQYMYSSLVQPHFDYCSEIWGCCNKTLSTKLQKLQNRAARILLRASYDTNSDFLIDKLGWRKLDKQRLINKATMVYKSLNGLAPNYLRSKFTYRSNVSSYSLRGTNDNLTIPLPHTNFMKNSFSYSGSVLWNSLPIELRQVNSLDAFRAGCKQHF